jgi:thiamine-phosphate pyrophosphorylase
LDALATACAASQIPVFAIGGITLERLSEVCGEGAHGVAVIGAILMRDDVAAAARGLCAEMTKIKIGWRTMSDR